MAGKPPSQVSGQAAGPTKATVKIGKKKPLPIKAAQRVIKKIKSIDLNPFD